MTKLNNCGLGWIANCYILSFLFIGTLVLVELFTAVILENFTVRGAGKQDFYYKYLQEWSNSWSLFDHKVYGKLSNQDFLQVMANIPPPFGFKGMSSQYKILKVLRWSEIQCSMLINPYSTDKKTRAWCVEYKPTIKRLTRIAEIHLKDYMENDQISENDVTQTSTVYEWYAVNLIQCWYKDKKEREQYYLRRWFAAWQIQTAWRQNKNQFFDSDAIA